MEKWAFIYTSGDGDGDGSAVTATTGSKACELVTVGVPTPAVDAEVIDELIDDGVELIELCGAFGPADAARVVEQVGGRVPVGYVTYPASEAAGLHALFG
ncbi:DUF6506 family protein [Actinomarinicola tropica]|uniref:Uncharacterized protein n=1 Tax=Actinomarinicola tropica TaxID=2789776 RepID=A0A5Q2RL61_9ACTN|nr:DUF6506 family protein [Actinomarinicola tropica]QGG96224.1 hypothetical protein GH723_14550 [Actinomarinicola tropica]